MEDGVKEDPAQSTEPKFLGKAGWLKKAPGRLLATYKDRYIHVERTEIVVYETEDRQNCLERLDLENYDKCHELKSPFHKKHRLILIRSSKPGNKVHDVKLQAQTAEEKEAWISALTDGINRAKNKVFDEVKVDESSNLEHVTRTRPKGNRNRRPPTRIHMKEVADVSSDGILRLDLDLEDAVMPNGNQYANVDGSDNTKVSKVPTALSTVSEAVEEPSGPNAEEEAQTEPEVHPQKKVIKPPMPPNKDVRPSLVREDEPDKDESREKKVLKPPMPPSKEAKPCASPVEETKEDAKAEKMSEKSPDAKKKSCPPPTPPIKPSSKNSLADFSLSGPTSHPPTPPSKEKKPSDPAVDDADQHIQGTADESKEIGEDNGKKTTETAMETDEVFKEGDKILCTKGQVSEDESEVIVGSGIKKGSNNDGQIPTEPLEKISSPLNKKHKPTVSLQTAPDTSCSSFQAEEISSVVESCMNDMLSDSLNMSPLLCPLSGEKKKKAEEKSVDSGQHSDDESEGSGSEDVLAASTAALRGSQAALDVMDVSEDSSNITVSLRPAQTTTKNKVQSAFISCRRSAPLPPQKPSTKVRSASIGDLLSDSTTCIQVTENTRSGAGSNISTDEVMKLEAEVALEMEKTSQLLSRVSHLQEKCDEQDKPEDLLAKAMEKLKMADHVLREVKKLKLTKNLSNRKSW
ncbi:Pleckstrin -like proteiny domain-containing family O member 2 [Channa argus]|uniref:Pleckstrin-like proteiny domain-containing family O member 2 n=1 Tax=Channa argus TaxID=215402 RepID=A0A6G1P9P9_CHAAH|nr:Pleckstrin -like proteiny domain-containing family O member 2 [Channa argus]